MRLSILQFVRRQRVLDLFQRLEQAIVYRGPAVLPRCQGGGMGRAQVFGVLPLLDHLILSYGFQGPGSPMAMPAKGGNTALTDADIGALLAYIRKQFGR